MLFPPPRPTKPPTTPNDNGALQQGVGTMIVAALACSLETLIVGFLQLVTAMLIVGWVWSIWWGWELLEVSRRRKVDLPVDSHLGPDGLL